MGTEREAVNFHPLTGKLPQKGPVVGMGSERLSTGMGLIIMVTPHSGAKSDLRGHLLVPKL